MTIETITLNEADFISADNALAQIEAMQRQAKIKAPRRQYPAEIAFGYEGEKWVAGWFNSREEAAAEVARIKDHHQRIRNASEGAERLAAFKTYIATLVK